MYLKFLCFIHVVLMCCICGCAPEVQDNTIQYWTGTGWYQEGKTPEEMSKDLDECEALGRQQDDPFVRRDCMRDRGYVLQ